MTLSCQRDCSRVASLCQPVSAIRLVFPLVKPSSGQKRSLMVGARKCLPWLSLRTVVSKGLITKPKRGIASDPEVEIGQEMLDSLQTVSDRNVQRSVLYALNYALNNKNSYIAPYIAVKEVPNAGSVILDSIYNSLSPEVATSKYGKELGDLIELRKKE